MEEMNKSLPQEEKSENNITAQADAEPTVPQTFNIQNQSQIIQNTAIKTKPIGSIADIIVMIINYILTGELISTLFLSSSFIFTWRTTVVYFLFFITATAYIVTKKKEISLKAVFPGAAALLLSLSFALHDDGWLSVIIFLAIILLSGIYCTVLTKSPIHSFGSYFSFLDILHCQVTIPLRRIFTPYAAMIRGVKIEGKVKQSDKKKILFIVLGVLISIPVLLVIIPLLIDSDAAFSSLISSLYSPFSKGIAEFFRKIFDGFFSSSDKLLGYIPALFISPYILSVMFCFRHDINKNENKDTSVKYIKLRKAPNSFLGTFLIIICAVYAVYLLSQTAYFFSAFSGRLPSGAEITVTQYARQGFFEMMKIAVINFILIALTVLFSKRENGKISALIKALDIFLCVFTIILSSTSISKIILYISRFGLTQKRVYVFVFDIILIIAFLSVILRFFFEKFPYMKVIISAVCVSLTLLGFVGTDKFIADKNADAYLSGKLEKIDIDMLQSLEPSSVEALVRIASSDKPKAPQAKSALESIRLDYTYYQRYSIINRDGTLNEKAPFDSLEHYRAAKLITENLSLLSEYEPEKNAYVFIEDTSDPIKSVSVSTEKEGETVTNAEDSYLLEDELYIFVIDADGIKKFRFSVETDTGVYSFSENTNYVSVSYDEAAKRCYVTTYFSDAVSEYDAWKSIFYIDFGNPQTKFYTVK